MEKYYNQTIPELDDKLDILRKKQEKELKKKIEANRKKMEDALMRVSEEERRIKENHKKKLKKKLANTEKWKQRKSTMNDESLMKFTKRNSIHDKIGQSRYLLDSEMHSHRERLY